MLKIFTGAPIWVWPLLVLLIAVGLRARRTRYVPVWLVYVLPLLGIMPLRVTAALEGPVWIWLVFGVAYGIGFWGGMVLQRRWVLDVTKSTVHLAGEPLTLIAMMMVFWANFAGGFLSEVAPQIYANGLFQLLFVTIIATSGGSFAGRAWTTLRARNAVSALC